VAHRLGAGADDHPGLRAARRRVRRRAGWKADHFYALEPRGDRGRSSICGWNRPAGAAQGALFARTGAFVSGRIVIEADPFAASFARMGARQTGTVAAPMDGDPDRRLPVFEIDPRGS
jgi:hypothetical protein